jgi:hypothetical protein
MRAISARSSSVPPDVHVAISVKDGERYLREAIESILAQRDVDMEVALYDNGSSDGTLEIARGYPGVSVIVNPPDSNFFHTMNRAAASTTARYLAPFAADDVMLPGNLARKVAALDATGAGYVHGPVETMDDDGQPLGVLLDLPGDEVVEAPDFARRLLPLNNTATPSVVLRIDALRRIGGFDPRSFFCADWLAWVRLALRERVCALADPLVRYRQHDGTASTEGVRQGRFAIHEPATMDEIFADDAFPEAWEADRPAWMAARLLHTAIALHDAGLRRRVDGIAPYAVAGRALLADPGSARARQVFAALAAAAGVPPRTPFAPVVQLHVPGAAAAVVDLLDRLVGSGGVRAPVVVTRPETLDAVVAALEVALEGRPALDIDLVAAAEPLDVVGEGVLALGADEAWLDGAEAHGAAAVPYAPPSPYARERDPARWELI